MRAKSPFTKKEYRRHISLIRPLRRKLQEDTTEFINDEIKKDAKDQIPLHKIEKNSNTKLTSSPQNQKDRHEPADEVDNEDKSWIHRLRPRL